MTNEPVNKFKRKVIYVECLSDVYNYIEDSITSLKTQCVRRDFQKTDDSGKPMVDHNGNPVMDYTYDRVPYEDEELSPTQKAKINAFRDIQDKMDTLL